MKKIINLLIVSTIAGLSLFADSPKFSLGASFQTYSTSNGSEKQEKKLDYYIAHVDRKTEKLIEVNKNYNATSEDDEMIIITKDAISIDANNSAAGCFTNPTDYRKAKEDLLCRSIFGTSTSTIGLVDNILVAPIANIFGTISSLGTNLASGVAYTVTVDESKFNNFVVKNDLMFYQRKLRLKEKKIKIEFEENADVISDKLFLYSAIDNYSASNPILKKDEFGDITQIRVCKAFNVFKIRYKKDYKEYFKALAEAYIKIDFNRGRNNMDKIADGAAVDASISMGKLPSSLNINDVSQGSISSGNKKITINRNIKLVVFKIDEYLGLHGGVSPETSRKRIFLLDSFLFSINDPIDPIGNGCFIEVTRGDRLRIEHAIKLIHLVQNQNPSATKLLFKILGNNSVEVTSYLMNDEQINNDFKFLVGYYKRLDNQEIRKLISKK